MKNSKKCPKCSSHKIIIIPGSAGIYGTGNNIPMGGFIWSSILVTRYLCSNCGFLEEWVEEKKDIERLKMKYGFAHKVD